MTKRWSDSVGVRIAAIVVSVHASCATRRDPAPAPAPSPAVERAPSSSAERVLSQVDESAREPSRSPTPVREPELGAWRATLASPGGELPFGLVLAREGGELSAAIENGRETIVVPSVRVEDGELVLGIDHYDSLVTAAIGADGKSLAGEWVKRSGKDKWTRMPFAARHGAAGRFAPTLADVAATTSAPLDGRWTVRFAKSADPAVGEFVTASDGSIEATFLTTTGDYRYLAGTFELGRLRLSCFDGAHAFLFDARMSSTDVLTGDFWSGAAWHETWTAERAPDAELADPFRQARWKDDLGLALLAFTDLDGSSRSLADPAFEGRARILQVLGSWCPNCHDETTYLAELDQRYRERGLAIVGLAFEHTGELARDIEQIRRLKSRRGAGYPILLAGSSDKAKAQAAFPALEKIQAFPTTVFLHQDGRVRAVHSGFSGPSTGAEHAALRAEFEKIVEELLAEEAPDASATWSVLASDLWRDERDGLFYELRPSDDEPAATHRAPTDGSRPSSQSQRTAHSDSSASTGRYRAFEITRFDRPTRAGTVDEGEVRVVGTSVHFGARVWHHDRRVGVLLDPTDFGHRLVPAARSRVPFVDGRAVAEGVAVRGALSHADPIVRREALFCLASAGPEDEPVAWDPVLPLGDPDPFVRATGAWAAARVGARDAVPSLVACLEHPNAHVRREAARALGKLAYRGGVDALRARVDDYDALVRTAASEALATIETR